MNIKVAITEMYPRIPWEPEHILGTAVLEKQWVFKSTTGSFQILTLHLYTRLFVSGATAPSGPGPPHSRGFTHNDVPHSIGLLWKGDQPVAETST